MRLPTKFSVSIRTLTQRSLALPTDTNVITSSFIAALQPPASELTRNDKATRWIAYLIFAVRTGRTRGVHKLRNSQRCGKKSVVDGNTRRIEVWHHFVGISDGPKTARALTSQIAGVHRVRSKGSNCLAMSWLTHFSNIVSDKNRNKCIPVTVFLYQGMLFFDG